MTAKPPKTKTVTISAKSHAKLVRYCKKNGLKHAHVIEKFITYNLNL